METFYVYQHRRLDNQSVFYVGKGKDKRAFNVLKRSEHWKRVFNKCGREVDFIVTNETEEFCFLVEREVIDVYKKRGIALVNATDGGEGSAGYKHTELHKQKLIGNEYWKLVKENGFKGKTHSDEQKQKWKESRKGSISPRKGVILSAETKEKISKARLGKVDLTRRVLTDDQVREIRKELMQDSIAAIARKYNVGESTIRRIRDGERYQEVK